MKQMTEVRDTAVKREDILTYNNVPVLKYRIQYPRFTWKNSKRGPEKINRFYEKRAEDNIEKIKTDLFDAAVGDYNYSIENKYPVRVYEVVSEYSFEYNGNCILSLYTDNYEYTGGAHGNTLRVSETWDLRRSARLQLSALFPENYDYESELKSRVIMQIEEREKENPFTFFEDYEYLVEKYFNPENFYLTPEKLVIYFEQYEIGPYASGIQRFYFPYDSVNATVPRC